MTEEIEAGPETDRKVAEALGTVREEHGWHPTGECSFYVNLYRCKHCGEYDLSESAGDADPGPCIPPYSTDWNYAMAAFILSPELATNHVIGTLDVGPDWALWRTRVGDDNCDILEHGKLADIHETGPLAICGAILKFVAEKSK
jgi:hypothetical protein